jgi:UDP-N-acetylmuramate-alanine ligase
LWILWALVPDLDNNNYFVNSDKKNEIKNIFDYIFTGKWLDYSLIKKYIFILEACEYKRHFLKLDIDRWIITNIELDHTDYYKDLEDYKSAFLQFSKRIKNKILTISNLSFWTKQSEDEKAITHKLIKTNIRNFNFKHLFGEHNNQNW